jgi:hypothetical protein
VTSWPRPLGTPLVRIRWAVRGVLLLGIAASVAGNILHARHNPISQTIAAWPPLALLLTVELIARVPVHTRSLAAVRLAATAAIAGIAAWVSYWHMAGVAARYGESGASPYLLPLSVDGLVIVASVCLVEIAGRIRTVAVSPDPVPSKSRRPAQPPTPTTTKKRERTPARREQGTPRKPRTPRATPAPPPAALPALPVSQRLAINRDEGGVELLPAGRTSG